MTGFWLEVLEEREAGEMRAKAYALTRAQLLSTAGLASEHCEIIFLSSANPAAVEEAGEANPQADDRRELGHRGGPGGDYSRPGGSPTRRRARLAARPVSRHVICATQSYRSLLLLVALRVAAVAAGSPPQSSSPLSEFLSTLPSSSLSSAR